MKQKVSKPIPGLLSLAYRNAGGAAIYQEQIDLRHNTEEAIKADITAVEIAVNNYEQSRTVLRRSYEVVTAKSEAAQTVATITREILKLKLGNQFSDLWLPTGFVRSLAMPRSASELQPLTLFLSHYLASNPGLEVPALNATAATLALLHEELKAAINAVGENRSQVDRLLEIRNQKVGRLRKRVRDLVAELHQVMEPTDHRWLAFGLNIPGLEEKPEMPEEIEVIVVDNTVAMLTFPRPARASYYRVYKRVIGVEEQPVYAGSPSDPNFTFEDLPQGATIEFSICAVNSGGESAKSPPVTLSTHL